MRFKLVSLFLIAASLPASAELPMQGNSASVSGTARIERGALGTYVRIDAGRGPSIIGYIPSGNESSFPGLRALDGRQVTMTGVVYWDGTAKITLTDPRQLSLG